MDAKFVAQLQVDPAELYGIEFVCRYFGGAGNPFHPATIYRAVNEGRISRPIKTMRNANRWLGAEIEADRRRMIEAKREPLLAPKARTRKLEAEATT